MPQLCFSTAARLAAKLLFYIESSFLCILSYNANTPLDDVGRSVAKIVHHAMLAGRSRCADYALAEDPNRLSLFISAPMEDRIARVAKRQKVTPEEAKTLIQKTDKRRAAYCEYYASKKWGAVDAYDFCLNSSALGLGGTVELIQTIVAHKEHPIPSPTEQDPTQQN